MMDNVKLDKLKAYKKIAFYAMIILFFSRFIFQMLDLNILADVAFLFASLAAIGVILLNLKIRREMN